MDGDLNFMKRTKILWYNIVNFKKYMECIYE